MSVQFGVQKVSVKALMHKKWLDTEMRVRIIQEKVEQYAQEIGEGANFPPPIVFFDTKVQVYMTGDGFHRILARHSRGDKSVLCVVKKGTYTDAILHCIETNRRQRGIPFSIGDKSKSAEALLRNADTSTWTLTKIAEFVGCATPTVSMLRSRLCIERPSSIIDRHGRELPADRMHASKDREEVMSRRKKVAKMFLGGTPQIKIAADLGVSRATIYRDVELMTREKDLVDCPHCHGTGRISNLNGRK
jgi:hypothetical protein